MNAPVQRADPRSGEAGAGLAIRGATVTYRNGHTALHDVSFAIPRGTITALVGVNGSGKSTLIKAVMGFVSVSPGASSILGGSRAQPLRRNIAA